MKQQKGFESKVTGYSLNTLAYIAWVFHNVIATRYAVMDMQIDLDKH